MKTSSQDSSGKLERPEDLGVREIRACQICGAKFSATGEHEFCPVCMLRKALAGGGESSESLSEDTVRPTPEHAASRFEHYEIVLDKEGKPLELGRGAMGVTYKAFDVDLRCPVTLKVISEKYLGDEAARLRFLREARAAASVRHPNVASVFHLGRRGQDYFYAMEFVEGETLDSLIKRSGQLEVKVALEITKQVAAGLAAVHKKKLVHRDIKPSNIMVSIEEEGAVTAKIIDLGLAKVDDESGAQTTISASGAFAGTPEFASPEQILGGEVDIRSDLYSLGVSLWQMVTGQVPFRGTAAGVMSQHQHAALPFERLEGVPQPVVSLIEVLLNKDLAQRFQTPAELLKALPTITDAIDGGRTITYESLGHMPDARFCAVARKPPARLGPEKTSIARLPVTGSDLFGREEDLAFLDASWANPSVNVVTIVAWGGVGKSALVNHWLGAMAAQHYRAAELVFGWSFYRQGTSGSTSSADEFLEAALSWFGDLDPRVGTEVQPVLDKLQKGEKPVCVESCPEEALLFGPRRKLIEEANSRIYKNPGKYVPQIYGEHEVGGTGYLYLSKVPFEQIGFRTDLGTTPYPEYTKGFLYSVPLVLLLWPAFLIGVNTLTRHQGRERKRRRRKIDDESNDYHPRNKER